MIGESQKQREQRKGYNSMRAIQLSPDEVYWNDNSDRDDFAKPKDTVGKVTLGDGGSGQFYSWITEDRIREIVRDEISKKKIDIRFKELQRELELLQSEVRYLKYCWDLKTIVEQEDDNENQM